MDRQSRSVDLRRTIAETDVLLPLLSKERITALVAPNDELAERYYRWLRLAGVAVPRQLSLLSFDNRPASIPFGTSSIDFGIEALGFQAFHLMLGDIGVRASSKGELRNVAFLNHYGTLARAPEAARALEGTTLHWDGPVE
jgi:DNA-binding LacI/PurR family transcriptional regulator